MAVKKTIRLIIFLLLFVFISGDSFAQESDMRIVSLSPSLTEEIFLLGAEDALVGVTSYCLRPERAREKELVGTVTGVSLEKIIALNPTIVLTTPLTDKKAKQQLENLGIRMENFELVKNFDQICRQFIRLGEIVGKKDKAQQIVSKAAQDISIIKEKVNKRKKSGYKVFVQIGADPLFTINDDYFINDMIEIAGAVNIAKDSGSGLYSREKVIEEDPDCIIIASMGIATEKEKEIWQRYGTLKAVKNNKVHVIDSYLVCSTNPQSFVLGVMDVVNFLYKEQDDICTARQ